MRYGQLDTKDYKVFPERAIANGKTFSLIPRGDQGTSSEVEVVESTTLDPDAKWTNYKYLWWIPRSSKGRFMAVGNLGQFIYVAPDKGCIIIRFGRAKPKDWHSFYPQLFASLVERL